MSFIIRRLVSVYTSVESDKKSFGLVLSDVIYH